MAEKEPPLPSKAHALRSRIFTLEQRWTGTFGEAREKVEADIAEATAEYEALIPEIEARAEKLREEIKSDYEALAEKRGDLLRLLGQVPEPIHRRNGVQQPLPSNGAGYFRLATEYPVAELKHHPRYEQLKEQYQRQGQW